MLSVAIGKLLLSQLTLTGATLLALAGGTALATEPFTLEAAVGYAQGSPPAEASLNQLDIYTPSPAPTAGSAPVVVYVHGGSLLTGDKGNGVLNMARLFTGQGYVFVSVNYRLSPNPPSSSNPNRIRYPAHPDDVGEAFGWLGQNIGARGGDASKLILVGHSAGAHLASLVATDGSFLRAYGTSPLSLRGVVALDSASYDLVDRADPATSTLSASGIEQLWNAYATPVENAIDGTWTEASPTSQADRRDAPHLLLTQASNGGRIAVNQQLAVALGQDPAEVVTVDLNHAGIKSALGNPADATVETEAVIRFVSDALATDTAPATRLGRKPAKRVKLRKGKRARVTSASAPAIPEPGSNAGATAASGAPAPPRRATSSRPASIASGSARRTATARVRSAPTASASRAS